jgi:hypothetical protein
MKQVTWFLGLVGLGLGALPGQAGWIVQVSETATPQPVPVSSAPAPSVLSGASVLEAPSVSGAAPAPATPSEGVIPAGCCLGGEGCCACAEPATGGWCRPGLLARLRQRWQERRCCWGERPGLLERLRLRRAERRASWCSPCGCPCP